LEARDDTLREMKETKRIMQEFRDEVAAAKEKKKSGGGSSGNKIYK
jgi:hypothetical protein